MRFRISTSLHLGAFLLLGSFGAMPALANYDGTLDTSLAPPLGADPFYGTPGLFDYLINLGGTGSAMNNDYVAATTVQVDGKILAAGWSWNTLFSMDQNACVLTRFNVDGTLDTSFAGSGRVVMNFGAGTEEDDCYISALALQGDGKIVAAGNLWDATHGERGIVFRFNANGTRDYAFNNGVSANHGYVIAGPNSAFSAVVIDTDGSIISVGHSIRAGFSDEDFFYEVWAGGNGNAIRELGIVQSGRRQRRSRLRCSTPECQFGDRPFARQREAGRHSTDASRALHGGRSESCGISRWSR